MRTECIVDPGAAPTLAVRIRCLQVQHRAVESPSRTVPGSSRPTGSTSTARCTCRGTRRSSTSSTSPSVPAVVPLARATRDEPFRFPAGATSRPTTVRSPKRTRRRARRPAARGGRRMRPDHGRVGRRPRRSSKVAVAVENTTDWSRDRAPRDEVVSHSLVAVHTMLAVDDGAFVSLLDPPEDARARGRGLRQRRHVPRADRRRATSCSRRRSSSTTSRRSPPRAPAISTTRPRSTRSSPCAC